MRPQRKTKHRQRQTLLCSQTLPSTTSRAFGQVPLLNTPLCPILYISRVSMRRGVFDMSLVRLFALTALALRRVAQIDEHIASLEHTIAFLKMERTNLRRKSGSRHPLFTPELLASIIEWGIFMRAFEPDDVMSVSTFWRQVVLQTPALWSRIIMTDLPSQEHIGPRMKRFLERSKDHALHIDLSVSESGWAIWRYEETLDDLAKLLRPHMRRCVYFSLGRGFDSFTMLQLVTELSPDVECISLWDFSFGGQSHAIVGSMRVRDQKAANLTYIRGPLHYAIFVGIHFPVLKHLELTDEALVEWGMLLNLLTNTPALRTLIIAKQELQLSAYSNLTPVVLPLLTTLRLIEWSTENLSLFFTYTSMPDLQELALLRTPAHAFPLDLIRQVKKLELPANSNTGWTARVLRNSTEVEELTMTSTTATREILELLANQLEGNTSAQPGMRTWLLPKMTRIEMDCFTVAGYNRIPVQELRGVLRRRRLGGVREISKLTLQGVEESEVERVKGELDSEVERLEVFLQSKSPYLGPARPWIPRRRRRSTSPIIIASPRRARHLSYIPGRSRSWRRSPSQRRVSLSPQVYTPPGRVSPENMSVISPIVIQPPPVLPPVGLPLPHSRSRTPSWRARYAPSSTERSTVIRPDESPRGRSPHRTPTIRSRSSSPRRWPTIVVEVPSSQEEWRRGGDNTIRPLSMHQGTGILPEESYDHSSPPSQPVNTARDDSQDGPRGATTFGRIPRRRSYRTSPQFSSRHPSPTYTPRRPIQLIIPPPSSPHPAFPSAQGLGTEESRNPRYHLPYRYGGRPATPPAITRWLTRASAPPSPPTLNVPQQSDTWAEPSQVQTRPWLSSPRLEQQSSHVVTGSAPWLNGPAYDYPMARFIPNTTLVPAVQGPPEPMVVQVPGHPSTRVVARVVRRTVTPPLDAPLAFGYSVPPAQQICSGFVLQVPATQAAAPCVVVSSNT